MIFQRQHLPHLVDAGPFFARPLVLLTHEFRPFHGGVATYCFELSQNIQDLGQFVSVWAPDYGRPRDSTPPSPLLKRLPGPGNLRPSGLLSLALGVWRHRRELEGSILLLPSVGAQMVVMLLSLIPGWPEVPTAVLWHGSELLRFERNPFWKFLALRFFPQADFYFAASPYVKKLALRGFLSQWVEKIEVIPCAPGSDAFLTPEPALPDAQGRVRILTLARLHPRKGQLHTVQALAALAPSLKEKILYQIAGEGDLFYLEELRQACENAGIAFDYLGPVPGPRLSSVYAQCDIYAMTSRSLARSVEGFGITYLEAGLQSKPVVACRSGGVEGAVIDGQTGLLVDENDLPSLTAAFASLIGDEALRHRLGEGNFRHASAFSWEHSARLLLGHLAGPPHKKG